MSVGFRREAKLLASESTSWILVAVYMLLLGYGAFQGVSSYRNEQNQIAKARSEYETRWQQMEKSASAPKQVQLWGSWRSASLAGSEQGGAVAWLDPGPLGALNRGYAARESPVRQISLFDSPIEPPLANPVNVMYGWMDFGFSILWLLPLVQLLLSFQAVGRDRELATWPLILASGASVQSLAALRLSISLALVAGITLMFGAAAVMMTSGIFGVHFLAWSIVVCAYAAFWTMVGGAIGLGAGSASRQLLLLGGVWVSAVWVGPGLLDAAAELLVPRVNLAQGLLAARDAQISNLQRAAELTKRVYEQHPDWQPAPSLVFQMNKPVPGGPRKRDSRGVYSGFLAGDEAVTPSRELAAQRRSRMDDMVNRFSALSPLIAMQYITEELAGTSFARYRSFDLDAQRFLAEWRGFFARKVWMLEEMQASEIPARPKFQPAAERESAVFSRLVWPIGGLVFWTLAAVFLLGRQFRSFRPI